jgi:hypothetical protein
MLEELGKIQTLENLFPTQSSQAFAAARAQVLASGQSVLQSEEGAIYEVFPDGRREFVKCIAPPIPVVPGTTIVIR